MESISLPICGSCRLRILQIWHCIHLYQYLDKSNLAPGHLLVLKVGVVMTFQLDKTSHSLHLCICGKLTYVDKLLLLGALRI